MPSDERHSWFGFLGSARHQKYTFPLKQTEPSRSPFILFCLEHTYTLRKQQSRANSARTKPGISFSFFAALCVLLYLLLGDIRPRIERNIHTSHKPAKKKKHGLDRWSLWRSGPPRGKAQRKRKSEDKKKACRQEKQHHEMPT